VSLHGEEGGRGWSNGCQNPLSNWWGGGGFTSGAWTSRNFKNENNSSGETDYTSLPEAKKKGRGD